MRVFVTGATGFVGIPVVKELISAGHQVLGLTRSDVGAEMLKIAGAEVHRGTLEDVESLKKGADLADAVIHLAFIHDFSKFKENCEVDGRAIEAMGAVLKGTGKPFIVTSGTAGLSLAGETATEDYDISPSFRSPRISEQTALALVNEGVSAAVVRLPQVHNTEKQGFVTLVIAAAKEKGVSAYIGSGRNLWSAAHVSDVARLYRLALEKHEAGAKYHAVGEEGVPMKDIAEVIGQKLNLPVRSITPEESEAHFGWFSMFAGLSLPASSTLTREKLDWHPAGPGLLEDLGSLYKQS